MPPRLKEYCLGRIELSNSPSTVTDLDTRGEIASVTRLDANSSGTYQSCRKIPTWAHGRAADSTDMMYYATVSDPVYYIYANTLHILPEPTSSQKAQVHIYNYPTVAHGETTISQFPAEAEYLVPLYASMQALQRLMRNKSSSLPTDISSLTISVAPPSNPFTTPAISPITVTLSGTAPVYTPPAATIDIPQLETYIQTDEDTELAQAQLGRIQSELSKYQADIQNELNRFNDANVEYQANVQKSLEQSRIDAQDAQQEASLKLQQQGNEYNSNLNKYQSQVNTEVQEFSQNLANFSAKIQKHVTDYQWLQGQYALVQNRYNQGLQILSGNLAGNNQEMPRQESRGQRRR